MDHHSVNHHQQQEAPAHQGGGGGGGSSTGSSGRGSTSTQAHHEDFVPVGPSPLSPTEDGGSSVVGSSTPAVGSPVNATTAAVDSPSSSIQDTSPSHHQFVDANNGVVSYDEGHQETDAAGQHYQQQQQVPQISGDGGHQYHEEGFYHQQHHGYHQQYAPQEGYQGGEQHDDHQYYQQQQQQGYAPSHDGTQYDHHLQQVAYQQQQQQQYYEQEQQFYNEQQQGHQQFQQEWGDAYQQQDQVELQHQQHHQQQQQQPEAVAVPVAAAPVEPSPSPPTALEEPPQAAADDTQRAGNLSTSGVLGAGLRPERLPLSVPADDDQQSNFSEDPTSSRKTGSRLRGEGGDYSTSKAATKRPPACLHRDGGPNPAFFDSVPYILHYKVQDTENRFLEHRTRHGSYRLLLALIFFILAVAAQGFAYDGARDQSTLNEDHVQRCIIMCLVFTGVEAILMFVEKILREKLTEANARKHRQERNGGGGARRHATSTGGDNADGNNDEDNGDDVELQQRMMSPKSAANADEVQILTAHSSRSRQSASNTNPMLKNFMRLLWVREAMSVIATSFLAVEFGYFGAQVNVERCVWLKAYDHRAMNTFCTNYVPEGFILLTLLIPLIVGRPRFMFHLIPSVAALLAVAVHTIRTDHLDSEQQLELKASPDSIHQEHFWLTARWTRLLYTFMFTVFCGILKFMDEKSHRRQFELAIVLQAQTRMIKLREQTLVKFVNTLVPSFLRNRLVVNNGIAEFAADISDNAIVMALDVEASFLLSTHMMPHDVAVKLGFISAICSGISFSWIKKPECSAWCHHIRSVGDTSILVGGLFDERPQATAFITFANYIRTIVHNLPLRVGLADGTLVGMPIGFGNIRYDVFGPALQEAQQLVSMCPARRLALSQGFFNDLTSESIVERIYYHIPSGGSDGGIDMDAMMAQAQAAAAAAAAAMAAAGSATGTAPPPLAPTPSQASVMIDDVQINEAALMRLVQGPLPSRKKTRRHRFGRAAQEEHEALNSPRGSPASPASDSREGINMIVKNTKARLLAPRCSGPVTQRLAASSTSIPDVAAKVVAAADQAAEDDTASLIRKEAAATNANIIELTSTSDSLLCCCEDFTNPDTRKEQKMFTRQIDSVAFKTACGFVALQAVVIAFSAIIDRHNSLDDGSLWVGFFALLITCAALLVVIFCLTVYAITATGVITAAVASVAINFGAALTRPSVMGDDTAYLAVGVMPMFIFCGESMNTIVGMQLGWTFFFCMTLFIRPLISIETLLVLFFSVAVTLVMSIARAQMQREIFKDTIRSQLANEAVKEQQDIREALIRGTIPTQVQWRLEGYNHLLTQPVAAGTSLSESAGSLPQLPAAAPASVPAPAAPASNALDSWCVESCIVISVSFFQHSLSSAEDPSQSYASPPQCLNSVTSQTSTGGALNFSCTGSPTATANHTQQQQQAVHTWQSQSSSKSPLLSNNNNSEPRERELQEEDLHRRQQREEEVEDMSSAAQMMHAAAATAAAKQRKREARRKERLKKKEEELQAQGIVAADAALEEHQHLTFEILDDEEDDEDDFDGRRAFQRLLTQQPDEFRAFIEERTAVIEQAVAATRYKTIEIVDVFCGSAVLAGPLEDDPEKTNQKKNIDPITHQQQLQARAVADAMSIVRTLLEADLNLTVGIALEQGINVLRQTEFPAHDIFGPAVNISRALMMEASFPMVCATEKVIQFFERECCRAPTSGSGLAKVEEVEAAKETMETLRFMKSEAWRIRGLGSIRVHQIRLKEDPMNLSTASSLGHTATTGLDRSTPTDIGGLFTHHRHQHQHHQPTRVPGLLNSGGSSSAEQLFSGTSHGGPLTSSTTRPHSLNTAGLQESLNGSGQSQTGGKKKKRKSPFPSFGSSTSASRHPDPRDLPHLAPPHLHSVDSLRSALNSTEGGHVRSPAFGTPSFSSIPRLIQMKRSASGNALGSNSPGGRFSPPSASRAAAISPPLRKGPSTTPSPHARLAAAGNNGTLSAAGVTTTTGGGNPKLGATAKVRAQLATHY